jgi:hypothetical protein
MNKKVLFGIFVLRELNLMAPPYARGEQVQIQQALKAQILSGCLPYRDQCGSALWFPCGTLQNSYHLVSPPEMLPV